MIHTCHAMFCKTPVEPRLFMCPKHWKMVPSNLKTLIWTYYVPGQEITKDPSYQYLDAAKRTIDYVAELESSGR